MSITKPAHGVTNWDVATNLVIDFVNAIAPNTLASDVEEMARDVIGTALVAGSNITITPNDGANTITIAVSSTIYSQSQIEEFARDSLGTALTAGSNISITPSDVGETITIAYTGNSFSQAQIEEFARDAVGSALVAGTNMTITVNDAGNTITLDAAGGGGGGFTQGQIEEFARDAVGTALVGGTDIDVTVNDGADTITIAYNADVDLPDPVNVNSGGTNVFTAGAGTANVWVDLPTNPANVSIVNPHSTKDMLVTITLACWLITATSGVDIRFGARTTGAITAAAGVAGSAVSPPSNGFIPLNANPSASVSFAATYSGIIPAGGTVNFIGQALFSSTTGQKQCNYPGIEIIPIRFLE